MSMPLNGDSYTDFVINKEYTCGYVWKCKWCGVFTDRGKEYCPDCLNEYAQLHDAEVSNFQDN